MQRSINPASMLPDAIAAEQDFQKTANSAKIMLWAADTDMRYHFLNAEWLHFTGRTLEQELGNGWAESIHPTDFVPLLKRYTSEFKKRKEFKVQFRLRRYDGTYHRVVSHGKPMYSSGGAFSGYMGSCIAVKIEGETIG